MDDEDGAEDGVQNWGHRVGERQDGQWDQGDGDNTFEAPVVGAVDAVRLGQLSGLVDGANDTARWLWDGANMSQAEGSGRANKCARRRTHGASQGTGSKCAQ